MQRFSFCLERGDKIIHDEVSTVISILHCCLGGARLGARPTDIPGFAAGRRQLRGQCSFYKVVSAKAGRN